MGPSGLGSTLHQAPVPTALQSGKVGPGVFALIDHRPSKAIGPAHIAFDKEGVWRPAVTQCPIRLFDRSRHKLLRQLVMSVFVLGDDDHPGGIMIEPVGKPDLIVLVIKRLIVADGMKQRALGTAPGGMDRQMGVFIDHQQMLILIDDIEIIGIALIGVLFGIEPNDHLIPRPQPIIDRSPATVDKDDSLFF